MSKANKDKGHTAASVYGKTLVPPTGESIEVQAAVRPFDHEEFRVRCVRVLVRKPDGTLRMHWANAHQETLPNGTVGNEYIGTGVNIEKPNSMSVADEAEFRAKCASSDKPYTPVERDDWPPFCLPLEEGPFAEEEEATEVEVEEEDAELASV